MSVELFEALDSQGNPIGERLSKEQIFAGSHYRLVTHAWMLNSQGEVLCQQRASEKGLWDNLWDISVGGGVAADEESDGACARELDEELGILVEPNELLFAGRFETTKNIPERGITAYEYSDTYIVQADGRQPTRLEPHEVTQTAWLPLIEVGVQTDDHLWVPHPQSYFDALRTMCMQQVGLS